MVNPIIYSFLPKIIDVYSAACFSPDMPAVLIDLTDEETARIDALATEEKRARKQQTHVLVLIGLSQVEAQKAKAAAKLQPTEQP